MYSIYIKGSLCTSPSPLSQYGPPCNLLPPSPLLSHPDFPCFSVLDACLQTRHVPSGAGPCAGDLLSPRNGAGALCTVCLMLMGG